MAFSAITVEINPYLEKKHWAVTIQGVGITLKTTGNFHWSVAADVGVYVACIEVY